MLVPWFTTTHQSRRKPQYGCLTRVDDTVTCGLTLHQIVIIIMLRPASHWSTLCRYNIYIYIYIYRESWVVRSLFTWFEWPRIRSNPVSHGRWSDCIHIRITSMHLTTPTGSVVLSMDQIYIYIYIYILIPTYVIQSTKLHSIALLSWGSLLWFRTAHLLYQACYLAMSWTTLFRTIFSCCFVFCTSCTI